jgi:tetratricopeptide (TPR) repeat protein
MDSTPGASYPFCRICTVGTADIPAAATGSFLFFQTRHVRWGRKCRYCGSVPRIKFFCYFGIPLIPLGGKYLIIRAGKGHIGRRVRKSPAEEHNTALAARYRAATAEHPELANDRHKEADARWARGDADGAIPLYEETLAEHEKTLGADHPASLIICHQIARAYLDLAQAADAIPLLQRVWRHRQRVLGDHPDTVTAFHEFADVSLVARLRRHPKNMYSESLTALEHTLGADHPRTIQARIWLGKACVDAQHENEALQLMVRGLDDSIRVLGPDHPDIALLHADLLTTCQAAHDSPNIPHIEEALRVRTRLLGADHADTIASRERLALAYRETGRVSPEART